MMLEVNGCLSVTQEPVMQRAFKVAANTLSPRKIVALPHDSRMIWIDLREVNLEEGVFNRQRLAQTAARRMILTNMVFAESVSHQATSND